MDAVGVDMAKRTFDAAKPLGKDKYKTHSKFENEAKGHAEFIDWLNRFAPQAAIFMEATGVYHEALADALVACGKHVYVINPAQIAAFAKSELARTKTDRGDAKLIARFGLASLATGRKLTPWVQLTRSQRQFKALVRRLSDLQAMRQMEVNRREVADPSVHESLDQVIAQLDAQIKATEKRIGQHIDDDPDLRGRRDLLTSIPGIGEATSAWLLACLGDTRQFSDVREAVAFVGLNPKLRESGQWKGHTRISKTGDSRLRARLYFPAIVAWKHNPVLHAFCERLSQRGKSKMVIIVAAMRKLIHFAWGVLRSNQAWDPDKAIAGG